MLTFFIFALVLSELCIFLAEMIFGTEPTTLVDSLVTPITLFHGVAISQWDQFSLLVTASMLGALALFLRLSRQGQHLVAVADNPALAELYGISRDASFRLAMGLAAAFVAIGMMLLGTKAATVPSTALQQFLVIAVVATLLAGIGRIFGAALAALLLGVAQGLSIIFISARWQPLLIDVVMVRGRAAVSTRHRRRGFPALATRLMSGYLDTLLILTALNALLALGFNLVLGFGGLLSIAQPMLYAVGAYGSALLSLQFGVPVWLAIPLGGLMCRRRVAAAVAAIVAHLRRLFCARQPRRAAGCAATDQQPGHHRRAVGARRHGPFVPRRRSRGGDARLALGAGAGCRRAGRAGDARRIRTHGDGDAR